MRPASHFEFETPVVDTFEKIYNFRYFCIFQTHSFKELTLINQYKNCCNVKRKKTNFSSYEMWAAKLTLVAVDMDCSQTDLKCIVFGIQMLSNIKVQMIHNMKTIQVFLDEIGMK